MRLEFRHRTDPGMVRQNNEDAYSLDLLDPRGMAALLIVADGMGGYDGGEVASHLAVETVRAQVVASAADWAEKNFLADGLITAIVAANRAILQAQNQRSGLDNMGTTLTAAIIWGERIIIGHIGDSKACLFKCDSATKVTTDHNVPGELVRTGHLTAAQAELHPQRNILTRVLGAGETAMVERHELQWEKGDVLLLCTDGLSNPVPLSEMHDVCNQSFDRLTDRLVDLANARGGHDNITVLAARWEE